MMDSITIIVRVLYGLTTSAESSELCWLISSAHVASYTHVLTEILDELT